MAARATLAVLAALFCGAADAQRVLHWVIRVSSLEDTIAFTTNVLGMKVLRHEENDEPCPLTCNGVFDTPWSKTMVGFGPEDSHYALELTFNYGINNYTSGEGLRRFVLHLDDAKAALSRALATGYDVEGSTVTGPDGYKYELLPSKTAGAPEPFSAVVLGAADPAALAHWYADMIGMSTTPLASGGVRVAFDDSLDVAFHIERTSDGKPPRIEQWEGRNAIALPEATLRAVNERLVKESPELVIHAMRELHEKLGTLFIVIVRDPGGYEVCLVSIETFDPSVREATNYVGPSWETRKEVMERVQGLKALDEARSRVFAEMQARMEAGGADDDDDDDDEEEEEEGDAANKDEV